MKTCAYCETKILFGGEGPVERERGVLPGGVNRLLLARRLGRVAGGLGARLRGRAGRAARVCIVRGLHVKAVKPEKPDSRGARRREEPPPVPVDLFRRRVALGNFPAFLGADPHGV